MNLKMEKGEFNVLILNYIKGLIEDDIGFSSEDEELFVEFIELLKGKNIQGFLSRVRPQIDSKDKLNYNLLKSAIEDADNVSILI